MSVSLRVNGSVKDPFTWSVSERETFKAKFFFNLWHCSMWQQINFLESPSGINVTFALSFVQCKGTWMCLYSCNRNGLLSVILSFLAILKKCMTFSSNYEQPKVTIHCYEQHNEWQCEWQRSQFTVTNDIVNDKESQYCERQTALLIVAPLHCWRWTWVWTRTQILVLYRNKE